MPICMQSTSVRITGDTHVVLKELAAALGITVELAVRRLLQNEKGRELAHPLTDEASFARPAVVVTAQAVLDSLPTVVQVVPLSTTTRQYRAEVTIEPELSGLTETSNAQCQHVRSVSIGRVGDALGTVSPVVLRQVREVLAVLLDTGGP